MARDHTENLKILARARSIRARCDIHQATIARGLGVDPDTLSAIEVGAREYRITGYGPLQRRYANLLRLLEQHLEIRSW